MRDFNELFDKGVFEEGTVGEIKKTISELQKGPVTVSFYEYSGDLYLCGCFESDGDQEQDCQELNNIEELYDTLEYLVNSNALIGYVDYEFSIRRSRILQVECICCKKPYEIREFMEKLNGVFSYSSAKQLELFCEHDSKDLVYVEVKYTTMIKHICGCESDKLAPLYRNYASKYLVELQEKIVNFLSESKHNRVIVQYSNGVLTLSVSTYIEEHTKCSECLGIYRSDFFYDECGNYRVINKVDSLFNTMILSHGVDAYSSSSPKDILNKAIAVLSDNSIQICCSDKTQRIGKLGFFLSGENLYVSNIDLCSCRDHNNNRIFGLYDGARCRGLIHKKEELSYGVWSHTEHIVRNYTVKGMWVKRHYLYHETTQNIIKYAQEELGINLKIYVLDER